MGGLESQQGVRRALAGGLGAGERLLGPQPQSLLQLFAGSGLVVLAAAVGRFVHFEVDLLLVEHILAYSLGELRLVDLGLVCVLAVLLEADVDAPLRSRTMISADVRYGIRECRCGGVEGFLLAVDARLLSVGDPLIEIDDRLFLVEVALQAALLVLGGLAHLGSALLYAVVGSAAGRPMW